MRLIQRFSKFAGPLYWSLVLCSLLSFCATQNNPKAKTSKKPATVKLPSALNTEKPATYHMLIWVQNGDKYKTYWLNEYHKQVAQRDGIWAFSKLGLVYLFHHRPRELFSNCYGNHHARAIKKIVRYMTLSRKESAELLNANTTGAHNGLSSYSYEESLEGAFGPWLIVNTSEESHADCPKAEGTDQEKSPNDEEEPKTESTKETFLFSLDTMKKIDLQAILPTDAVEKRIKKEANEFAKSLKSDLRQFIVAGYEPMFSYGCKEMKILYKVNIHTCLTQEQLKKLKKTEEEDGMCKESTITVEADPPKRFLEHIRLSARAGKLNLMIPKGETAAGVSSVPAAKAKALLNHFKTKKIPRDTPY
ncbi:hypothetical protein KKF84_12175 [Myxococcota bacterium]|nr:hypothetical protein [Myxococcota bacterium]